MIVIVSPDVPRFWRASSVPTDPLIVSADAPRQLFEGAVLVQQHFFDQITTRRLRTNRRHPVGHGVITADDFLSDQRIEPLLERLLTLQ